MLLQYLIYLALNTFKCYKREFELKVMLQLSPEIIWQCHFLIISKVASGSLPLPNQLWGCQPFEK